MCATISTSPVAASVATQVTRPAASNFGLNVSPSSMSFDFAEDCVGVVTAMAFVKGARALKDTRLLAQAPGARTIDRNRACSSGKSRKTPEKREVIVRAPCLAIPRTDMQVCSASISTATPRG